MRSRAHASTLGQNRDQACKTWCGERGLDAGEHRRRRRAACSSRVEQQQQQGACGGTGRQGAASRARPLTLHASRFEVDQELHTHEYLRRRARGRRAESGRLAAMLVAASMPPRPVFASAPAILGRGVRAIITSAAAIACSSSTVRGRM